MPDRHALRFARLEIGGRAHFAEVADGAARLLDAPPWAGGRPTGEVVEGVDDEGRSKSARRLAPVAPTKIVCVGRNYRAHAKELGNEVPIEPLLFLKPPSAIVGPDAAVVLPPSSVSTRVEHEAELAVILGRRIRHASEADAMDAVFGYTVLLDVTARDLQKKDGQWTRAKGMDTFCPVGPVVVSGLDPASLGVRCTVGSELRQSGTTSDMIFSVAAIIRFASRFMTLEPGDILSTGTPSGVGPLAAGDEVTASIDGIGSLSVRVVAADSDA